VTKTGEALRTKAWWPGVTVDVAAEHVVVDCGGGNGAVRGGWPAIVAAAGEARAAFAAHLSASAGAPSIPGLLLVPT
jgi:hypothetical protein